MDSQMDHKERKHSLYRFFASPAPRYWFVLSHRYIGIELQQYLASIPELNDPILQKDYFKSYKFSKDQERMLEFWRKAINGLYKCVYDTISLTKHKIKDDFTINKITPYGMDNIIRELVNRGQLIPLEQLRSREYFRRKNAKVGWIKTGAKTMYAYTLGMFFSKPELIPDASYLACTGYLKSIYKRLQARLRVKNSSSGMRVLTSSALQAELRDLGVPESSQEAFLIYLEETSIVAKRSIDINTEQRIEFYKLPADSLVMAATDTAEISEKEKAYLILSTNIENLGKKLEALEKQIKNSLLEAQKAVKYKCARVAKLSLKQRSVYQEYWEKFTILKCQLEGQLLMMETWEASGNLLKALQLGDEAYKAMKINIEEVKEVVANAKERMEEQKGIEKIIEAFGTAGDIKEMQDDEELLREYEALVTEEDGTPPQAKKASPGSNGLSPPAKTESMTKAEQEKQPA